jgi:hypothetical protein
MLKRALERDACEKRGWFWEADDAEGGRKSFIRTNSAISAVDVLIWRGVFEFTSTGVCVVYMSPAVTRSEYRDAEDILRGRC